jgi:hypothetical protein
MSDDLDCPLTGADQAKADVRMPHNAAGMIARRPETRDSAARGAARQPGACASKRPPFERCKRAANKQRRGRTDVLPRSTNYWADHWGQGGERTSGFAIPFRRRADR